MWLYKSTYGDQLIRPLNSERKCKYFISLQYVQISGKASTRRLNHDGILTEGRHPEL